MCVLYSAFNFHSTISGPRKIVQNNPSILKFRQPNLYFLLLHYSNIVIFQMITFNLRKEIEHCTFNFWLNLTNLAFMVEIRSFQKKNDSCIKSFFYFKDGLRFISILWGNLVTKEFCLWSLFTVNNSRNSITKSIVDLKRVWIHSSSICVYKPIFLINENIKPIQILFQCKILKWNRYKKFSQERALKL